MNPAEPTVGFNVIGHVGANLGVGVATRQVIDLATALGYRVTAFDVDLSTGRARPEDRFGAITVRTASELPDGINVFVLGLGAVNWALSQCPDEFFDGSRLNAIVCFWELPVLPARYVRLLDRFDVVIGASEFMRDVFERSLSRATTLLARLPVSLPPRVPFDRGSLDIPASAVVFVFSFDPASDPERKNPMATLRAYLRASTQAPDAWLVIRINNATNPRGQQHAVVDTLREAVAMHPRVVLVTAPMSYSEVLGMYEACDVFVSLHRAEGLGLGMAEAMVLGKPVVATNWSGNRTFMRHANACLVDYDLIPVRGTLDAYREDALRRARWAEPHADRAAAYIAYLANDAAARDRIGRAAAEDMAAFNHDAGRGAFLADLAAIRTRRDALATFGAKPPPRVTGRPHLDPPARSWPRWFAMLPVRIVRKLYRMVPGHARLTRLFQSSTNAPRHDA